MMKIIGFTDHGIRMWPLSVRNALKNQKIIDIGDGRLLVMSGYHKGANINSEHILVGPNKEDKAYLQKLEEL